MRYLQRQIDEIRHDPALRLYGCALALTNALAAVYWLFGELPLWPILDPDRLPVCWPLFPACGQARLLTQSTLNVFLWSLTAASVANGMMFFRASVVPRAYWMLAALTAVKYAVVIQDFRLTLNHHYMTLWVWALFAFVPGKRTTLKIVIVLFYLWAGVLKLYPGSGWLSGSGLYGRLPLGIPAQWVPAECAYVVALELLGSVALFARRPFIFWSVLGQFALFHVASFWVVGFFYPILMFGLLSLFPLTRLFPESLLALRTVAGESSGKAGARLVLAVGLIVTFSACQVFPRTFPGDPTTSGEGRMFALNMFDAPTVCRAAFRIRHTGEADRLLPIIVPYLNARIRCDPLVYWSVARERCRVLRLGPWPIEDFGLLLSTKKLGEPSFRRIVDIDAFCASDPSYSLWSHNSWILAPG